MNMLLIRDSVGLNPFCLFCSIVLRCVLFLQWNNELKYIIIKEPVDTDNDPYTVYLDYLPFPQIV